MAQKTTIGRAELVDFPEMDCFNVPAKIDTGADNSAIWASQITISDDSLSCVFFGPDSPFYTGRAVTIQNFSVTRIANSFGQSEMRYKVKLPIQVKGRVIRATFTLSDRSLKMYPVLLGRRLLAGKFLVDVSEGEPLTEFEQARARKLKRDIETFIADGGTL